MSTTTPNYAQVPHRAPAIETVRTAYEMHYDGASLREIVTATCSGRNYARDAERITGWLNNPHLWAPWLDTIALERAAWFDRSVIENLSVWEWQVFTGTVDIPLDASHGKWNKWAALPEPMRNSIQVARLRRAGSDAVVEITEVAA